MKEQKQKRPQVVTTSHVLASDEHIPMYEEVTKKGKPNKKGRMNESRGIQRKKGKKNKGQV